MRQLLQQSPLLARTCYSSTTHLHELHTGRAQHVRVVHWAAGVEVLWRGET